MLELKSHTSTNTDSISKADVVIGVQPAELLEPTASVPLKEGYVLKAELYCLFGMISMSFYRIFANSKEVVKRYEDQITHCFIQFVGRPTCAHR